jgi:hypothetical protein
VAGIIPEWVADLTGIRNFSVLADMLENVTKHISDALGKQAGVFISLCTGQPEFLGDEEAERISDGRELGHDGQTISRNWGNRQWSGEVSINS